MLFAVIRAAWNSVLPHQRHEPPFYVLRVDLLLIIEFLTKVYCGFGEPLSEAHRNVQVRIEAIIAASERLATAPFRGKFHDDLLPGPRDLILNHAVYWFRPRSEQRELQVFDMFFGDCIIGYGCGCTCCKTAPRAEK